MIFEITNAKDLAKTLIAFKGKNYSGGCYVKTIEIKMSGEKEILIDIIAERTILRKPASLPFRFCYHPETGIAYIHEVMDGRNDRIKEFYYPLWFGNEEVPLGGAVTDVFDGGRTQVTGQAIADFVHAVRSNGEAFVERPGKTAYATMDFAIVFAWKAIKAIFPKEI